MFFRNSEESHAHSLQTLNMLYEYDDFMASISTVADLGCGDGQDLEWWATRTTRDESPKPLNINCVGVDVQPELLMAHRYRNITYQQNDFEKEIFLSKKRPYDLIWSHNSFQYCINPIATLSLWWQKASMLVIVLPQTTNLVQKQQAFEQPSGCFYHHTLVSLIHMLAVSGWDCRAGYFLKRPTDNWLHAIVYKSEHAPMDPKITSWHDLAEKNLLPDTVAKSAHAHNAVRQQDLILPWIDKSLTWYGKQ